MSRAYAESQLGQTLLDYTSGKCDLRKLEILLRHMTIAYHCASSGTMGEVITRWMALGFLEEFPTIAPEVCEKSTLENLDGNINITLPIVYSPVDGPLYIGQTTWKFNISTEKIESRLKIVDQEEDLWWKKYWE